MNAGIEEKWIKSGHEKKGKLKEGRRKRKEGRLIKNKNKKKREDERKKIKTRWL